MKPRITKNLLAAWLSCVGVVFVISEPLSATAQRRKTSASASTTKQVGPTARFDSGDEALRIPLDIDNNIIRMDVRVNNSKPFKFIFDTGASLSFISSQRAAELGLKMEGQFHGDATGGNVHGYFAKDVSLSVKGAQVSNQSIASFPLSTPPGFDFDGIIGCDFIGQFVVEIDYEHRLMNLYSPRTYRYAGKGEVIPLVLAAGETPLVRAKIILAGRPPLAVRLEVDTGGDGTFIINSPLVKKEKLAEALTQTSQRTNNGAGGSQSLLMGRVKAVQLGRVVLNNPPVGLSQDTEGAGASTENDGLIGGEVFRRFKVILDYSRRRMILEPNKSLNDPFEIESDGD